jgi:hypothetical protein
MRATGSARRGRLFLRTGFAVLLASLLLLPLLPPTAATPMGRSGTAPPGNPGSGILYGVTWNTHSTANATTTGSALSVSLAGTITMQFSWSSSGKTGPPGGVSEVEFQAFLFGFSFITRALTNTPALTTPNGVSNLTWDPGALSYIIAGDYLCLASIFAPNGTTIWSESFYIKASAPFVVGALLPIILLLLLVYELYAVLTVKPTPPKGAQPWKSADSTAKGDDAKSTASGEPADAEGASPPKGEEK